MITFLRSSVWSDRRLIVTLMLFRCFNAILLQTFYVPDEYWQSLEVAHRMAFGTGYLTWEWRQGIRGYSYPFMFAVLYKILENFNLHSRYLLVLCPKLLQACISSLGDVYVYKVTDRLFGHTTAFWSLLCHISSWFVFYTAPRTLTNTMEMAVTTVSLYYYPWSLVGEREVWRYKHGKRLSTPLYRTYMIGVAVACVMRSTAAILWAPLCVLHLQKTDRKLATVLKGFLPVAFISLYLSMLIDKTFHGHWISVHYNFLIINFMSDIGAFYGSHSWHWYLTQGLPVVLGPQLILSLIGIYKSYLMNGPRIPAFLMVWTVFMYSYLSHKEFRFLLPIVPLAHVYAGVCLESLYRHMKVEEMGRDKEEVGRDKEEVGRDKSKKNSTKLVQKGLKQKLIMVGVVMINLFLIIYTSLVHQRGTLDVTRYLHENIKNKNNISLLFLMPCHSTPFYSHIHHNVSMRFLTCEPNLSHISDYSDEADRFYSNPTHFIQRELGNLTDYSHIIFFSSLLPCIKPVVDGVGFVKRESFFHTHFTSDTRVGTHVLLYTRYNTN